MAGNLPERCLPEQRLDPAKLLARMPREEARARCGRLKIFFGAAPGVGKSYAMLEAARKLRAEHVDVVAGCRELHRCEGARRPRSAAAATPRTSRRDADRIRRRRRVCRLRVRQRLAALGLRHPARLQHRHNPEAILGGVPLGFATETPDIVTGRRRWRRPNPLRADTAPPKHDHSPWGLHPHA